MRTLLAPIAPLLLVALLAGCSSSDGSEGAERTTTTAATTTEAPATTASTGEVAVPTRDDYVAAMADNLSTGSEDEGQLVIGRSEAECMAPKWVDAITVEQLQENEITIEELSDPGFDGSDLGMEESQGVAMVDAFEACDVDVVTLFTAALTQGLEADQQACVAEKADPVLVKALLAATFSTGESDSEFEAVVAQLTTACDLPPA